ncbi:organic cation transporter protein [Exaiptasia diaphana]|uniref:Major facilitator superfamily (MFS) profile domain-containing protein n=1 Tax=Exaiptasia diaphana TaxID=2652724 RepID=A0A913Y454_EXADI|nr:organic cation transporter protein [Exaiptasia diaphana]KXJ28938.1 Organic cation transporter protein [Exaiptasia diaphana]
MDGVSGACEENNVTSQELHKKPKQYVFDDLFEMVGGLGRYPAMLYLFTCIMSIPIGLAQLVQVFYGASPSFECSTTRDLASNSSTCPVNTCCANCSSYDFQGVLTSAVSEWNLICSRSHLKAMTQAVYMAGLLVGSFAFGVISDRFGRRLSIFLSIFLLASCGVASGVADCLSLFALFRFGTGAACAGCLISRYVYCVELVVTKHRTAAGFISNIFVSIGFNLLALLAYLIRDWRHLMLAVSLPAAPLLVCWWFIPESPRWLIAQNRIDEAHQLLLKFACKNRVKVDEEELKLVILEIKKAELRQDNTRKYGVLDLVKTRKLRKRTIICCFNWFVNTLVYFGINLNVKNLGGDMYLNFFILSIIEIPGALFCWFLMARFGRRIPYSVLMLTSGIACMLVLAFPSTPEYRYGILTLAMIGKICIMSTFLAIYVYTVELYPTLIRNIGIGTSSMMARFGGIAAPYVVLLADLPNVSKTLPLVIFGVMGVTAGIMSLWLPETLHVPMAQTVEQTEIWPEDYQIHCCRGTRRRQAREQEKEMPRDSEVTLECRL